VETAVLIALTKIRRFIPDGTLFKANSLLKPAIIFFRWISCKKAAVLQYNFSGYTL